MTGWLADADAIGTQFAFRFTNGALMTGTLSSIRLDHRGNPLAVRLDSGTWLNMANVLSWSTEIPIPPPPPPPPDYSR